jgi:hypothetical protein
LIHKATGLAKVPKVKWHSPESYTITKQMRR